jgi:prefoldin subunit 5
MYDNSFEFLRQKKEWYKTTLLQMKTNEALLKSRRQILHENHQSLRENHHQNNSK